MPERVDRRRRSLPVAVAVAVAVLASCGSDSPSSDDRRLTEVVAAVCDAARQAAGDVAAARTTFAGRAHDGLHDIARELEEVDRALAARLLEAKAAVEGDFNASPPPASVVDDLTRLADRAREGLARLAVEAPPCQK